MPGFPIEPHRVRWAIAVAAVAFALASPAAAETQVSGTAQALRLDAHAATVQEALTALNGEFDVRLRTSVLLDHRIDGTYSGSLRDVITRLLAGYNFVARTASDRVELFVYGIAMPAPPRVARARPASELSGETPAAIKEADTAPTQVAVGIATALGPQRRMRPRH